MVDEDGSHLPPAPKKWRPRMSNVVTTGNILSGIASLVPLMLLLWSVFQWFDSVDREFNYITQHWEDVEAKLNKHDNELSDIQARMDDLRHYFTKQDVKR